MTCRLFHRWGPWLPVRIRPAHGDYNSVRIRRCRRCGVERLRGLDG